MLGWKLKSCPRCGGDLFIEKDLDSNWYEQCLQCGYLLYLPTLQDIVDITAKKANEHRLTSVQIKVEQM
jgi:hypothetical protein